MNIHQTNTITIFFHVPYIYWFITIIVGKRLAHQNIFLDEKIVKTKHTYQNFIFRDFDQENKIIKKSSMI